MKKMLPILLLVTVSNLSNAQPFTAGQKIVAGNLSFSHWNTENNNNYPHNRQTYLLVSPSFAKVKNNSTIYGASISFNYSGSKSQVSLPTNSDLKSNDYNWSAGLFVQKLKWLNDKWCLYAEAGVQGGIGTHKSYIKAADSLASKGNSWATGIYITPGTSYRLTQHLLVDLRFNNIFQAAYSKQHAKENTLPNYYYASSDNLIVNSSLNNNTLGNIAVGFRWVL